MPQGKHKAKLKVTFSWEGHRVFTLVEPLLPMIFFFPETRGKGISESTSRSRLPQPVNTSPHTARVQLDRAAPRVILNKEIIPDPPGGPRCSQESNSMGEEGGSRARTKEVASCEGPNWSLLPLKAEEGP